MIIRFSGKGLSCRRCAHEVLLRVHRVWWMRLISSSRLYRCDRCHDEYLVLGGSHHVESTNKRIRSSS